jgi:hypothetical protein
MVAAMITDYHFCERCGAEMVYAEPKVCLDCSVVDNAFEKWFEGYRAHRPKDQWELSDAFHAGKELRGKP